MKCPECKKNMKKVEVEIEGAKQKAISYQCSCGHFEFEKDSAAKVVEELKRKETPLKISHKIVKLSKDRLGMYFNKHVINSLDLKAGEEIEISVPDKKHIVLKIG